MKSIRKYLYAFLIIFALLPAQPVFAHDGEPRLEVSIDRLNPGRTLDLRGVNFDYEEVVSLVLIGAGVEISFEQVTANLEGEFTHSVTIPVDLVEGTYYVRGTTPHHWVISPPLTVWGVAYEEGGGQGLRDEDDGLLAPMPTYPPAAQEVATAPVPAAASAPVEAASVASGWGPGILSLTALMVLVAVIMLARRKRSG